MINEFNKVKEAKGNYKGFSKTLTKDDLNEEERKCYDNLMEGINDSSTKEKEEVAHLMEVFIEADEKVYTKCARCGKDFEDTFEGETPENKRIYCDDCLNKMWGSL